MGNGRGNFWVYWKPLDFDFEGCHLSKTWLLDCDLPLNKIFCNYIFNDMSLPCNLSPQKRKA